MKLVSTLKLVKLDSDPSSVEEGELYFNSSENRFKVGTSGSWVNIIDTNNYNITSSRSVSTISNGSSSFSYAVLYEDSNSILLADSASSVNFIVPSNETYEIPVGSSIKVVRSGEGSVEFTGESGVTINSPSDIYLTAQWSDIDLIKVDTDTWILSGEFPDIY